MVPSPLTVKSPYSGRSRINILDESSGLSRSVSLAMRSLIISSSEVASTYIVSSFATGQSFIEFILIVTVALSEQFVDGSGWAQVGLDIDGESAWDNSGYAVSLSADGMTVAIGAYQNDGGGKDAGHVRVYAAPPAN